MFYALIQQVQCCTVDCGEMVKLNCATAPTRNCQKIDFANKDFDRTLNLPQWPFLIILPSYHLPMIACSPREQLRKGDKMVSTVSVPQKVAKWARRRRLGCQELPHRMAFLPSVVGEWVWRRRQATTILPQSGGFESALNGHPLPPLASFIVCSQRACLQQPLCRSLGSFRADNRTVE